jgi:hypothetical protein
LIILKDRGTPDDLKDCVVKLYIIKAHIPLRSLDPGSIVIPEVRAKPERAPHQHPSRKCFWINSFGIVPPDDRANDSSPFLKSQLWHSGKITALKHCHCCHLVLI